MIIIFDARTAGGISSKGPDYPAYLMRKGIFPSVISNGSSGIKEYRFLRY